MTARIAFYSVLLFIPCWMFAGEKPAPYVTGNAKIDLFGIDPKSIARGIGASHYMHGRSDIPDAICRQVSQDS